MIDERVVGKAEKSFVQRGRDLASTPPEVYLVVFGGVTKKVPEEVEMGAPPDEDEVGRAVGEVSGGRQALWTAGARAAHTGGVDGDKLSVDHPPTTAAIWKGWNQTLRLDLGQHELLASLATSGPFNDIFNNKWQQLGGTAYIYVFKSIQSAYII